MAVKPDLTGGGGGGSSNNNNNVGPALQNVLVYVSNDNFAQAYSVATSQPPPPSHPVSQHHPPPPHHVTFTTTTPSTPPSHHHHHHNGNNNNNTATIYQAPHNNGELVKDKSSSSSSSFPYYQQSSYHPAYKSLDPNPSSRYSNDSTTTTGGGDSNNYVTVLNPSETTTPVTVVRCDSVKSETAESSCSSLSSVDDGQVLSSSSSSSSSSSCCENSLVVYDSSNSSGTALVTSAGKTSVVLQVGGGGGGSGVVVGANPMSPPPGGHGGGQQLQQGMVTVPYGWRRLLSNGVIIYISPSNTVLASQDQVKDYLLTPGTCKCGLECPLKYDSAFSFDLKVSGKPCTLTPEVNVDLTKLCNHKRKLLAMSSLSVKPPDLGSHSRKDYSKKKKRKMGIPYTGLPVNKHTHHQFQQTPPQQQIWPQHQKTYSTELLQSSTSENPNNGPPQQLQPQQFFRYQNLDPNNISQQQSHHIQTANGQILIQPTTTAGGPRMVNTSAGNVILQQHPQQHTSSLVNSSNQLLVQPVEQSGPGRPNIQQMMASQQMIPVTVSSRPDPHSRLPQTFYNQQPLQIHQFDPSKPANQIRPVFLNHSPHNTTQVLLNGSRPPKQPQLWTTSSRGAGGVPPTIQQIHGNIYERVPPLPHGHLTSTPAIVTTSSSTLPMIENSSSSRKKAKLSKSLKKQQRLLQQQQQQQGGYHSLEGSACPNVDVRQMGGAGQHVMVQGFPSGVVSDSGSSNASSPSFMEDPSGYLAQQTALLNSTINRQTGVNNCTSYICNDPIPPPSSLAHPNSILSLPCNPILQKSLPTHIEQSQGPRTIPIPSKTLPTAGGHQVVTSQYSSSAAGGQMFVTTGPPVVAVSASAPSPLVGTPDSSATTTEHTQCQGCLINAAQQQQQQYQQNVVDSGQRCRSRASSEAPGTPNSTGTNDDPVTSSTYFDHRTPPSHTSPLDHRPIQGGTVSTSNVSPPVIEDSTSNESTPSTINAGSPSNSRSVSTAVATSNHNNNNNLTSNSGSSSRSCNTVHTMTSGSNTVTSVVAGNNGRHVSSQQGGHLVINGNAGVKSPLEMVQSVVIKSSGGHHTLPPGHILVSSGGQLLMASTNGGNTGNTASGHHNHHHHSQSTQQGQQGPHGSVMAPPPPKLHLQGGGGVGGAMPPLSVSPMVTNVTAAVTQVIPAVAQQVLGQQTVLVNTLPTPSFVLHQPGVTMTMDGLTAAVNHHHQQHHIPHLLTSPGSNLLHHHHQHHQLESSDHHHNQQQQQHRNNRQQSTGTLLSPPPASSNERQLQQQQGGKKGGKKRKLPSAVLSQQQQQQAVASMLHIAASGGQQGGQQGGQMMSPQGFSGQIQMHSPQAPVMQALTIVPGKGGAPPQLVMNGHHQMANTQQLITNSQPTQQINLLQPVNLLNGTTGMVQNFPTIQQFIVPNLGGMVMNADGTATLLPDTNLHMQLQLQNVNGQNVLTPVQTSSTATLYNNHPHNHSSQSTQNLQLQAGMVIRSAPKQSHQHSLHTQQSLQAAQQSLHTQQSLAAAQQSLQHSQHQQQHSPHFLSPSGNNGGNFLVNGGQFSGQLSPLVASVSPGGQQVTFRTNGGGGGGGGATQEYIQCGTGQMGQALMVPCTPVSSNNQNTTFVQQNTTIVQQQTTMVANSGNSQQNTQNSPATTLRTINLDAGGNFILSEPGNTPGKPGTTTLLLQQSQGPQQHNAARQQQQQHAGNTVHIHHNGGAVVPIDGGNSQNQVSGESTRNHQTQYESVNGFSQHLQQQQLSQNHAQHLQNTQHVICNTTGQNSHVISTSGPSHNILSTSNSPHNILSTSNSPHNILSTSNSPHNIISTSNSPHNILSTSNSPHNILSTSNSPHNILSTSSSPHNLLSTTSSSQILSNSSQILSNSSQILPNSSQLLNSSHSILIDSAPLHPYQSRQTTTVSTTAGSPNTTSQILPCSSSSSTRVSSVSTQTATNQTPSSFCQTSTSLSTSTTMMTVVGSPPDTTTSSSHSDSGGVMMTVGCGSQATTADTTTHTGGCGTDEGLSSPAPSSGSGGGRESVGGQSNSMAMVHCISSSEPDSAEIGQTTTISNELEWSHGTTPPTLSHLQDQSKVDFADIPQYQQQQQPQQHRVKKSIGYTAAAESSTILQYEAKHQDDRRLYSDHHKATLNYPESSTTITTQYLSADNTITNTKLSHHPHPVYEHQLQATLASGVGGGGGHVTYNSNKTAAHEQQQLQQQLQQQELQMQLQQLKQQQHGGGESQRVNNNSGGNGNNGNSHNSHGNGHGHKREIREVVSSRNYEKLLQHKRRQHHRSSGGGLVQVQQSTVVMTYEDDNDECDDNNTAVEVESTDAICRSFVVGDLVWAPANGCAAWPGQIVTNTVDSVAGGDASKVLVRWFGGDRSVSEVATRQLRTLTQGLELHHSAGQRSRTSRKLNSQLEKAIQEAMAELDKTVDSTPHNKIKAATTTEITVEKNTRKVKKNCSTMPASTPYKKTTGRLRSQK